MLSGFSTGPEMLIPISWRLAITKGVFRVLIVRGIGVLRDLTGLRAFPPANAALSVLAPTTTSTFNVLLAVRLPTFGILKLKRKKFVPNTLLILGKKSLVFLNSSKDSQVPIYSKHSALAQEILTVLNSAQVAL
jgi:hypothetical protein